MHACLIPVDSAIRPLLLCDLIRSARLQLLQHPTASSLCADSVFLTRPRHSAHRIKVDSILPFAPGFGPSLGFWWPARWCPSPTSGEEARHVQIAPSLTRSRHFFRIFAE